MTSSQQPGRKQAGAAPAERASPRKKADRGQNGCRGNCLGGILHRCPAAARRSDDATTTGRRTACLAQSRRPTNAGKGKTNSVTPAAPERIPKYTAASDIRGQAMVLFCSLMRRRINAKHHRIVKQFATGFPDCERSGLSYGIRPPAPSLCGKSTNRRWPAPPFFQLS